MISDENRTSWRWVSVGKVPDWSILLATAVTTAVIGSCSQSDDTKPANEVAKASCQFPGTDIGVTLTDEGSSLEVAIDGARIPRSGSLWFVITVFEAGGPPGISLFMNFHDGEQSGYKILDFREGQGDTDIDGSFQVRGDAVTGTFPADAGSLAGYEVASWTARVYRNFENVSSCPLTPFPSGQGV